MSLKRSEMIDQMSKPTSEGVLSATSEGYTSFIALSDATATEKAQARLLGTTECTGTGDSAVIIAALNQLT